MDTADLYAVPLSDFVAERNALAKRLKAAGREPDAAEVAGLRKPSIVAWALNQVARRERDTVERLMVIVDEMKEADPRRLRELSEDRRELIAGLVQTAEEILADAGHSAGSTTLQRVTKSLYVIPTDDERTQLVEGRLERELEGAGLEGFGFGDMDLETEPDVEPRPSKDAKRSAEKLARAAERAEERAARLRREAEELARAAQRAADEAAEARREARDARAAADWAIRAL